MPAGTLHLQTAGVETHNAAPTGAAVNDATLRRTADAWLAAGRGAMLVEVVADGGSEPRHMGTRGLLAADGVAGTMGSGHLKWQAMAQAGAWLGDDWRAAGRRCKSILPCGDLVEMPESCRSPMRVEGRDREYKLAS